VGSNPGTSLGNLRPRVATPAKNSPACVPFMTKKCQRAYFKIPKKVVKVEGMNKDCNKYGKQTKVL